MPCMYLQLSGMHGDVSILLKVITSEAGCAIGAARMSEYESGVWVAG